MRESRNSCLLSDLCLQHCAPPRGLLFPSSVQVVQIHVHLVSLLE